MWKRSFRARLSSTSNKWKCENEAFVRGFLQLPTIEDVKTKLSCATSFKVLIFKVWKWRLNWQWSGADSRMIRPPYERTWFHAVTHPLSRKNGFPSRRPFNSNSWSCENEAFVRDFPQTLQVWDVTTKLFPLTSLSSDIPLLWHPFSVTSLGYDMHCTSIAIRNTEVRLSNFLWLERPIDLRLCVCVYVYIWLVVSTPLKDMNVIWDDYSQYMQK